MKIEDQFIQQSPLMPIGNGHPLVNPADKGHGEYGTQRADKNADGLE
jgi:hypothetical protein